MKPYAGELGLFNKKIISHEIERIHQIDRPFSSHGLYVFQSDDVLLC